MTALDVADLVVIAGRVLGIGTDAALDQADIAAAHAALAEARSAGHEPGAEFADRAVAVAAGVGLMHALLRHRPFPRDGGQLAVAAAIQFLALNGWRADLEPPDAAVVVVETLAAGRLSQESAGAWLLSRTSPLSSPPGRQARLRVPVRRLGELRSAQLRGKPAVSRKAISVVVAISAGGLTLLATACSQGPHAHVAHTGGQAPVTRGVRPDWQRARRLLVSASAAVSCSRCCRGFKRLGYDERRYRAGRGRQYMRMVVGTSEPGGYLRPGVTLNPGEELATSAGHAEPSILAYINENEIDPGWIAAGRPICPACAVAATSNCDHGNLVRVARRVLASRSIFA